MLVLIRLVLSMGYLLEDRDKFGFLEKGVNYRWGFGSIWESVLTLSTLVQKRLQHFVTLSLGRWWLGGKARARRSSGQRFKPGVNHYFCLGCQVEC